MEEGTGKYTDADRRAYSATASLVDKKPSELERIQQELDTQQTGLEVVTEKLASRLAKVTKARELEQTPETLTDNGNEVYRTELAQGLSSRLDQIRYSIDKLNNILRNLEV